MAGMLLDDLIEGLSGAVADAQARVEKHQVERFKSYFDSDKLPSLALDTGIPASMTCCF